MKFWKLVLSAVALSSSVQSAFAQDFYWSCGNGNWGSGSCWSETQTGTGGFGVPAESDSAFIYNTGPDNVVVTYDSNLYPNNRLDSYTLEASNTGSLSLVLQGEQTLRTRLGSVGDSGSASVIQNGGINQTYYLDLGRTQSGNGSYYLNEGSLITRVTDVAAGGSIVVPGPGGAILSGTGAFVQSGGIHQTSSLNIGNFINRAGSSTATYELNAGTLNTTTTILSSNNSVFNQTAGLHTASQLRLNSDSNPSVKSATYNLSGGTLSTPFLLNSGVFNYTGGALQLSGGRLINSGTFLLNKGEGQITEFDGNVENRFRSIFDVADGETAVFKGLVSNSGDFTGNGTKVIQGEYMPGIASIPPPPIPDDPFSLPDEPVSYFLANGTSLAGNVIFEETSTLSLFVLANGQSDWLSFSGTVDFNGTLNLSLGLDEFTPMLGDSWDIIFGNDINGTFSNVISDAPPDWAWEILYLNDRVTLTSISSVPVPASLWLFGSGLIGLIGFARRKKT